MIYTINEDIGLEAVKQQLVLIMKGLVRNTYFAGGLWFLTCLFVVKAAFVFIRKLKYDLLLLTIGLGAFYIAEKVIVPRPVLFPHWFYNIDSAFYYINFYITGFVFFPYIQRLLLDESVIKKWMIKILGMITLVYTVLLFFEEDMLRSISDLHPFMEGILPLIRAYLVIIFIVILSYSCRKIKIFCIIGRETLYLCGNEYIIKTIFPMALNIVGLNISLNTPLSAWLYSAFLLILGTYIVIPIEKHFTLL